MLRVSSSKRLALNGSLMLALILNHSGVAAQGTEVYQSLPEEAMAISPAGQHLEDLLDEARRNRDLPVNEWFLGAPARAVPLIAESLLKTGVTAGPEAEALYLAHASGLTGNIVELVFARQQANDSAKKGNPAAQCRLKHEQFLSQWSTKTPPTPQAYREFTEQTHQALMASKDLLTLQCEAQHLFNLVFRAKDLSEPMPELEESLGSEALDVLAGLAMPEGLEYWKANEALCFLAPHWPDLVNFLREQEFGPEDFCITAALQKSAPSAYHLVTAYLDPPTAARLTDETHKTDPVVVRLLEQGGDAGHLPSLERLISIYEAEDPEGASEGLLAKASTAGSTRAALMIARRIEALLAAPDQALQNAASKKPDPLSTANAPDPKKVLHYYRLAAARGSSEALARLKELNIPTNQARLEAYREEPTAVLKDLKQACLKSTASTRKEYALARLSDRSLSLDRSVRLTTSVFPLLTHQFGQCLAETDRLADSFVPERLRVLEQESSNSSRKWCDLAARQTVAQWEMEETLRNKGCF